MAHRDVIAIGTSAGGVDALRRLAAGLPADLPAAVLIVVHLSSAHRSVLDEILERAGPLPVGFARDGEPLRHGRIYLGPPGCHLLLEGDRLTLGHGPRENYTRPAIDPLFRSVALCCGHRAIGVVLTGTLGDGASGLLALQACGGMTVIQDPLDADYGEMPQTALQRVTPDHLLPLDGMPDLLARLVRQPAAAPVAVPPRIRQEVAIARGGSQAMTNLDHLGRRSTLACPDCHGVMWEIDEGGVLRYRCHVGHAYTAELLQLALDDNLARALASALRALDERIAGAQRLADHARACGEPHLAESWGRRAAELEAEAETIRTAVDRLERLAAEARAAG